MQVMDRFTKHLTLRKQAKSSKTRAALILRFRKGRRTFPEDSASALPLRALWFRSLRFSFLTIHPLLWILRQRRRFAATLQGFRKTLRA